MGLGKAIPLLVFGLIFTTCSVYVSFLNSPFSGGITTTGTVTDVTETTTTSNNRTTTSYGRIVTFETRDRREITFDAEGWESRTAPRVGEQVEVSYRQENPNKARVVLDVPPLDLWGHRAIILAGALMTLAGLDGIVRRSARKKA